MVPLKFSLEFPLELTDLICKKLNGKLLPKICIKNREKTRLYSLLKKQVKKYWNNTSGFSLLINNDFLGIKYQVKKEKFDNHASVFFIHAAKFCSVNTVLEILAFLITLGADINYRNGSAIRHASKKGDFKTVKYLVERGSDITVMNNRPVINACGNGHLKVVKYLVEQGADITDNGNLAVITASKNGKFELVKYLVHLYNDITCNKTWIETSMNVANYNNHFDIYDYLSTLQNKIN
jgi:hypothetical protein